MTDNYHQNNERIFTLLFSEKEKMIELNGPTLYLNKGILIENIEIFNMRYWYYSHGNNITIADVGFLCVWSTDIFYRDQRSWRLNVN